MSAPFTNFNLPGNHLRISHSSRSVLNNCKRKFYFRKFFPEPIQDIEGSLKAELGKALHTGYQHFLSTSSDLPMDERIEASVWEYMKKYPIHMCQSPNDAASLETGYAVLMEMISSNSMIGYELAKIKCLDGEERYAIEVPFEIILEGYQLPGGITVSITGFIDAIFYNAKEDLYHVLDIKTSGRNARDGDFSPLYQFNEQCVSYGFVLEYLRGRAIENFKVMYLHCKVDMKEPKALLYEFDKGPQDVQNWYNSLLVDLMNIRTFLEMNWFPRDATGNTCFAYGSRCPYYEVCEYDDLDVIAKIFEADTGVNLLKDEATESKTEGLIKEFKPWIKFAIEMPGVK